MEIKETELRTARESIILEDAEYYKYIFKKTEKIACAVFYIIRSDHTIRHNDAVLIDLERATKTVLELSLQSLKSRAATIEEHAGELRHALIALESNLRVAHAARYLSYEILEVFLHEIDSVQRTLRKYTEPKGRSPLQMFGERVEPVRERKQVRVPKERQELGGVSDAGHTHMPSRRDRVLLVLRDKGEATIKDIVDVVTDCSEKTIQRELISLIKDNVITREGERRWSKYKLV
jgi:hypothetical protein